MKIVLSSIFALIVLLTINQLAYPQEVQTNGKVCGNPSAPCSNSKWRFQSNDISFKLPPTLKWTKIKAFRNIPVHNYLGIDLELIWKTIENDLPELKHQLQ